MAAIHGRHPARTLLVFFAVVALLYALVALAGHWKPRLGLDLQGGTRITLIAKGDVSDANLREAASIIDDRVNGSGVSEAEVMVQGNRFVVVEIPGESRRDLVDTVKRQAQLRFRLVANTGSQNAPPSQQPAPDQGAPANGQGSDQSSGAGSGGSGGDASQGSGEQDDALPGAERAPYAVEARRRTDRPGQVAPALRGTAPAASDPPGAKATDTPSTTDTGSDPARGPPSGQASATDDPSGETSDSPSDTASDPAAPSAIDDPLAWMRHPDQASLKAYQAYTCPKKGDAPNVDDNPDKPLVTCDQDGRKFLLSPAIIEGTQLDSASAGQPQNQINWVVDLTFDGPATKTFADVSRSMAGTGEQFAIVLDGTVISDPVFNNPITNGRAQIDGSFTEQSANALATSLKFGALPIAFQHDPPVETVGPSLAGNQLTAGVTAGIAGLILVMIYCLIYYRGLGIVVVSSLIVAGVTTYACVMLLSKTAGFTLSLPGIAGLIVAVGITADSFIVFFERIRDEMRDGRSMRSAVEAGWVRARNTCLAADAVSLLAAVVLYVFATGVVKGFAFALGLSTVIDLVVFFWFTKPLVSLLATRRFFNQGHRLSGLDAAALGVARIATDHHPADPRPGPTGGGS